MVAKIHHFFAFIFNAFGLWWSFMYVLNEHFTARWGYLGYIMGKLLYLTCWGQLLQTFYFGIAVLNDIIGTNVRPSQNAKFQRSKLQKFRDNLFSSIMFPVGMFVCITFWGIYAVDRELVYPKKLDLIIPQWMNHIMHTTVFPFIMLEMYLVYIHYPPKKWGLIYLISFAGSYLIWTLFVAFWANIWVYPILQNMKPHERAVFIMLLMALFFSIYLMGEGLNKFLWRKERNHFLRATQKKK